VSLGGSEQAQRYSRNQHTHTHTVTLQRASYQSPGKTSPYYCCYSLQHTRMVMRMRGRRPRPPVMEKHDSWYSLSLSLTLSLSLSLSLSLFLSLSLSFSLFLSLSLSLALSLSRSLSLARALSLSLSLLFRTRGDATATHLELQGATASSDSVGDVLGVRRGELTSSKEPGSPRPHRS
jgi:hypothetical protein